LAAISNLSNVLVLRLRSNLALRLNPTQMGLPTILARAIILLLECRMGRILVPLRALLVLPVINKVLPIRSNLWIN
jgi:hypothetical protein